MRAIALLGHNGAGSTLAHSLIGIKQNKNSRILIDGVNINSWSIRKRGEIISYVMQNPKSYDYTIYCYRRGFIHIKI